MSTTCDVGTLFYYDMFFELERWRGEIPWDGMFVEAVPEKGTQVEFGGSCTSHFP
jgi:hypothetical protein